MGGTTEKLQIVIDVDDKGTPSIRAFGKEIDTAGKKGKESFGSMGQHIDDFNKKTNSSIGLMSKLTAVIAAAGVGTMIKRIGADSIDAASDLQEVGSKFETVFKGQTDVANQWASDLRDNYAMSRRESREYLSSLQDLLVPMGMVADKAGKMSYEIVKLSADLGSFNNKQTSQVMDDMTSALVGNYETMKKYGVVLNAANVEEKALAMGLARTKEALTASHKAQAAYQLIVAGSAAAIGDMQRTSDGYANTSKDLSSAIEDVSAIIGKSMLPAATQLKKEIAGLIDGNEELIGQKIAEYVQTVTEKVSDAIGFWKDHGDVVMTVAGYVGKAAIEYGKFWAIAKTIAGAYALVTFYEKVAATVAGLTAGTIALNTAMKSNLLAIGALAGYEFGKFLTAASTGTIGIDDEIAEEKARTARYAAQLRQAEMEFAKAQESGQGTSQSDAWLARVEQERAEEKERDAKALKDKTEAYKVMYKDLGTLNREYYDLLKSDIEYERDRFIAATGDKALAQEWFISRISDLEADFNRAGMERVQQTIDAAVAEKETMTQRLEQYQAFYGQLQDLIRENAAIEKQHILELNALYKQQADLRMSTETMIRQLLETQMTPAQRYESQRSGLAQQYASAVSLSGQEQIKALEAYKQAVSALASQYSDGIRAENSLYGAGGDRYAVSSREIIDAAISDIQRAAAAQQTALQELEAEKERQIEADRAWGAELTKTAQDVAAEIQALGSDIDDLGRMIDQMNTLISINADVSQAEFWVQQLESEIDALRRKAEDPIRVTIIREVFTLDGGESAPVEGSFAVGTQYVPKTGLYWLHQGETVRTPSEAVTDRSSSGITIKGDINIIVPESAAPQQPSDWRNIAREYIIPELRKVGY